MQQLLREHKVPVGVTLGGLLVVLGLASAPAIMAESESEVLARQNAGEIAALTESFEARTAEMQKGFEAQVAGYASAISNLENQISILNKATSRIHSRQVGLMQPSGEIQSSISSLADNTDLRLDNVERAVSRMHRVQNEIRNAPAPEAAPAPAVVETSNPRTEERLNNLDKLVNKLLLQQQKNFGDPAAMEVSAGGNAAIVLGSDDAAGDAPGASALRERISVLEREVRLGRVERSISRLGERLESIEGSSGRAGRANGQLRDIKDYIEGLLSDLEN